MKLYLYIILIIASAFVVKFAFFTKAKPKLYKGIITDKFPRFLASLLCRAKDGGKVIFTHEKTEKELIFEKQGGKHEEFLYFCGEHEKKLVETIEEAMSLIRSLGFEADDSFSVHFDYEAYFDTKLATFKMAKYQQYLNPANQRIKADEK